MKNKKFIRFVIIFISIWTNMLLLFACGNHADEQKVEEENIEINTMEEADERNEYPVYLVESIDNLHLDSDELNIENYFIRNECQYSNHYYIDSDNVLWGYGDNEYGQLGNGQQYSRDADGEYRLEMTPQKIAENVIHVDFGGYFVIFLTENGELYGIGANLNGVMGLESSEDYVENPAATVVTEPVCLMQDVIYARASRRGVVALQNDGSVWWWGEIITTSAKNIEDTKGVSYAEPEKMLDDAIYVTCGDFSIAAIKEDGTLWTWGNNTFGSCGYDCGDEDFIEEPVMVLEDVKMVWMDEARFDTLEERLSYGISPYTCDYTYVTFVEKNDGSLLACGYEVKGEGSKSCMYTLYGDILRTSDQMNGVVYDPVTVGYSDIFQRIEFCEKDRQPQLQFKELEFGMSSEKVTEFLDGLDIDYKIVDGISEEEKVYEIVTEDQYFTFYFDEKHELTAIYYSAYGTRNGKITIGMTRQEVEAALNQSCSDEIYGENDRYITAFYQDDNIYEVGYFDGIVYYIEESMGDGKTEEENDEQYDSQTDLIYNNGLPYGQPMNFDTGGLPSAYIAVIQEYCRTGMFPDGQDGGDIPGKISYAVYDVDGDGKDELILKNQDTITAGMTERVYAYEDGVFREEFSGFPALTYYDNGLIQAEWSHNQGKAGDRIWPYTLYQYQPDDDNYIMLESVDAWDKELADFTSDWGAFPDDIDADGDGYIYFLLPSDWEGQYSRADIVDDSDYENWRNHYLGGTETLEIPYRELEVETVFPDAAG